MISVPTQRFGVVERPTADVITFPSGIYGFELQLRWLMLGDREHGGLYWLQNVEDPELSLSVVDPREFVSDYSLHVRRDQLCSILSDSEQLIVVCVLTEYERKLCLNLRNPIVVNPQTRVGRQVVALDDRPLQFPLPEQPFPLRHSA
jgi:flagellar assembly factor FliW